MAAQSFSFNLTQARRVTINIRSAPYSAAPAVQGGAALGHDHRKQAAADWVVGEVADEVAPPGTATESTLVTSDAPPAPRAPPADKEETSCDSEDEGDEEEPKEDDPMVELDPPPSDHLDNNNVKDI